MPANKHRRRGKKYGFQTGRLNENKGKKLSSHSPNGTNHRYIRLTKDTFESRVNVNENKTFTCKDVDGTDNDVTVLRSLSRRPKLIDECAIPQNASVHPDLLINKLYRPYEVQNMFNTEINSHRAFNNHCSGEMVFDAAASRKWGNLLG